MDAAFLVHDLQHLSLTILSFVRSLKYLMVRCGFDLCTVAGLSTAESRLSLGLKCPVCTSHAISVTSWCADSTFVVST